MQIVSYLRVSTARQGVRLGAGGAASSRGSVHGRWGSRPQLSAALTSCRLHRATLVIAKLDRLSPATSPSLLT